ncbi:MAG: WD40 repeat domain-containing protein [Acidobacteriota bacterium]
MALKWKKKLSKLPLCVPPETCTDDYMVNSAAISDDGSRGVAGTYYFHYPGTTRVRSDGKFGTYCYSTSGKGKKLWADEYQGDQGIYAVAISGDGTVAAGAGLLNTGKFSPYRPRRGLLRVFQAATGAKLLDSSDFPGRVTSVSLSRNGGVLAAVAESSLYVFLRSASGSFSTAPTEIDLDGYSPSVAVHPGGSWLAACDNMGKVYVSTIQAGVVSQPATWTALERTEPLLPHSPLEAVKFNCVSVARASNSFAVGGGDFVYLFTLASIQGSPPAPVARFTSFDLSHHNVRFVAISDNGAFVTAVMNDKDLIGKPIGRLVKLSPSAGLLSEDWRATLKHPPNSTSIDSSGGFITAADGFPNPTPGAFYLFDNAGAKLWEHPTPAMNWPMVISANGSGIAAGSDDNTLFFFTP